MRDIYLIDFENVASEGLSGITYLAPEDEVIIFYSNNSKSLSMKMHILIGKSVCKLSYFEAAVGGKNALDHQISTWLGYLVGTGAAERNYYIVSRDMGYKFVASFWSESEQKPSVRCVDSIKAAARIERNRQQQREAAAKAAARATEAAKQPETQPVPVREAAPAPVQAAEPVRATEVVMLVPVAAEPPAPQAAEETAAAEPVLETPAAEPETPAESVEPVEQPEKAEESVGARSAHSRQRYRRNRSRSRSEGVEPQAPAKAAEQPKPELKAEQPPQEKPKAEQKAEQKPQEKPKAEQKPEQKQAQRSAKVPRKGDPKANVELTALIAPYPGLQEARLRELIAENKKQILCNTLRKQLGQEKGLALYNAIKKSAWH